MIRKQVNDSTRSNIIWISSQLVRWFIFWGMFMDRYNWYGYSWEYPSMVGRLRRSSIFSISWWMGVCILYLFCNWCDYVFYLLFLVPQFTAFELNMGLVSLTVRCLVFIFRRDVQKLQPEVWSALYYICFSFPFVFPCDYYKFLPDVVLLFVRFSNTSCSIYRALHSSQHMHSWCCSGQRYTIRLCQDMPIFWVVFWRDFDCLILLLTWIWTGTCCIYWHAPAELLYN